MPKKLTKRRLIKAIVAIAEILLIIWVTNSGLVIKLNSKYIGLPLIIVVMLLLVALLILTRRSRSTDEFRRSIMTYLIVGVLAISIITYLLPYILGSSGM